MSPRRMTGLDAETLARWIAAVAAERERRAPPPEFDGFPDIPAGRYTDPDFFALEHEALMKRCWVYAGHVDELPARGSYFVFRRTGAPILVVRGEDGTVRAFYNTCRHRGAPVARGDAGHAGDSFTCGYHGWTYRLDGSLQSVTDARDFGPGLDAACRGLVPVRCGLWGNFVYVCEDAAAEPLEDFLEPAARFFRHLPMQELRLVHKRTIELAGHYKVVLENFLEAYHFRLLHQHTTHRIFDHRGTSVHLWAGGHSMMLTPNRRAGWVDPGTLGMPEFSTGTTEIERHHNPSYGLFPNMILPMAVTGAPCVLVWPDGPERSVLEVLWFAPDGGGSERHPLWPTRIANFDRIVDEDVSFVGPIQQSIATPGFRGVPLSWQERRIYHWHEALDRRIGIERIVPALRVAPRVARWIEP